MNECSMNVNAQKSAKNISNLIIHLFFRVGIKVLGMAADGDPRLLCATKNQTNLQFNPIVDNFTIFTSVDVVFTQDPTHIGTKSRNRLLKPSISLPFGSKSISIAHLKMLIDSAPKEVHGLVLSDISPDDRQNFGSLEKVMEVRVLNALKMYVIVYLNICKNVTSSYLSLNMPPLERIYKI